MSLRGSPIRRLQLFNRESNSQVLALSAQVQRLSSTVHSKNLQIKELYDEIRLTKLNYQEKISTHVSTIKMLEEKLKAVEVSRNVEFQVIREKYDKLAAEESQNMKSYHSHEIQFLLKEIANLRVDCAARDQKLVIKENQITSLTQSFERQLEQKINQINNLNRALLSIQDTKNRQIKQITTKRELQKSRTSGVLSSRKQNNQFMDKQIRKLNQQILEKAIKIENLTREVNKVKRKAEETERALNKKIQDLVVEKEEESREREEYFAKLEKNMKQEILEYKSNELKYLGEIDTLKSVYQSLKSEIRRNQDTIGSKEQQINGYKQLLNKQRQQHAKQIGNLMKQKRRRSSNLGSSRSLSSSLKDSGGANGQDLPLNSQVQANALKKGDSIRLATVKQESPDKSMSRSLQRSNLTQDAGQQQSQIVKVVYHYDTLIQQLKRSHISQIELMKHKLSKISKTLDEKQHELLDMLTRFSPLVKIHAEEKSVEEDRKERIQRHWKADLALLEIMLDKYRVQIFR